MFGKNFSSERPEGYFFQNYIYVNIYHPLLREKKIQCYILMVLSNFFRICIKFSLFHTSSNTIIIWFLQSFNVILFTLYDFFSYFQTLACEYFIGNIYNNLLKKKDFFFIGKCIAESSIKLYSWVKTVYLNFTQFEQHSSSYT